MPSFRQQVPCVAALALLIQVTGLAISPLALCCASRVARTVAHEHEEAQLCPMHHASKPVVQDRDSQAPADARCTMKNACKAPNLALLSVLGSGLVGSPVSLALKITSSPVGSLSVVPVTRDLLPDTPPPRA